MIEGIVGYPGSGKSLFAALLAYRTAEAQKQVPENCRRQVWANFPVAHAGVKHFTRWDEVKDLYDSDVYIDEAHLWFPAREFQKYGKVEDMITWAQHRHDGLNMIWIAQSPGQIDVQIREMFTAYIYKVVRLFPPKNLRLHRQSPLERVLGQLSVVKKYEAENYGKSTKQTGAGRGLLNCSKHFGIYDTTYTVGDRNGNGARYGRGQLASEAANVRERARLDRETYLRNTRVDEFGGAWGRTDWLPNLDDLLTDYRRSNHAVDTDKGRDGGSGRVADPAGGGAPGTQAGGVGAPMGGRGSGGDELGAVKKVPQFNRGLGRSSSLAR